MSLLQTHIDALAAFHERLKTLRRTPLILLKSPSIIHLPAQGPKQNFEQIKKASDELRSSSIQEALYAAQASFQADRSGLELEIRREQRKASTQRPISAGSSPMPASTKRENASQFPVLDQSRLELNILPIYIREFNSKHNAKLCIWQRTTQMLDVDLPIFLRFVIPDVLMVYIVLIHGKDKPVLQIDRLTAFGPREMKFPYDRSDYTVYQVLSQQISKMLEVEPDISVQSLLDLLSSYDNLFVEKCHVCQRVLSSEGHVPPVVRKFTGSWTARHAEC